MLSHSLSRSFLIAGKNQAIDSLIFLVDFLLLMHARHPSGAQTPHKIADGLKHAIDDLIPGTLCNASVKFHLIIQKLFLFLLLIGFAYLFCQEGSLLLPASSACSAASCAAFTSRRFLTSRISFNWLPLRNKDQDKGIMKKFASSLLI